MLARKIAVGALFAFLSVSVAGVSAPAMAQERKKELDGHNSDVHRKKYAGWQRTKNGSWVQPVGDPRYPGASPSGGAGVATKDDMDAEAFKPKAMINPGYDERETEIEFTEQPTYRAEPEAEPAPERTGPYIDKGSVFSQESTVPSQP